MDAVSINSSTPLSRTIESWRRYRQTIDIGAKVQLLWMWWFMWDLESGSHTGRANQEEGAAAGEAHLAVGLEDLRCPLRRTEEAQSSIGSCVQDAVVGAGGAGRQEGQAENWWARDIQVEFLLSTNILAWVSRPPHSRELGHRDFMLCISWKLLHPAPWERAFHRKCLPSGIR